MYNKLQRFKTVVYHSQGVRKLARKIVAAALVCGTICGVGKVGAYPPQGASYPVRALNDTSDDYPFLSKWETNYLSTGPVGCDGANTGHWTWRVSGLGCNMNRE